MKDNEGITSHMKSIITKLWKQGKLPIKDGVFFSSGNSYLLKISSSPEILITKGDFFDLNDFYHKNKDEVTDIDILKEIKLSNGFYCNIGEGSYGSEGFISYLDSNKNLIWVIYSETSNPFVNVIEHIPKSILVESSSNIKLTINLSNPIALSGLG